MNKKDQESYDLGMLHAIQGDPPEMRYSPSYMDGWWDGVNQVKEEAREAGIEVDDLLSVEDVKNCERLKAWRKKWTEKKQ